ncbi:tetratricopeptide repeat protein, partial [Candidatus Dependentiae bacterium]|nr:tetratricopeptide repeat protein [Candidatus Dependentiae bacterium]
KIIVPTQYNGTWGFGCFSNGTSKRDWDSDTYYFKEKVIAISYAPNLTINNIKFGANLKLINISLHRHLPALNLGVISDFGNRKDFLGNFTFAYTLNNILEPIFSFDHRTYLWLDGSLDSYYLTDYLYKMTSIFGIKYNIKLMNHFNCGLGYEYVSDKDYKIFLLNMNFYKNFQVNLGYSRDYLKSVSVKYNCHGFEAGYTYDDYSFDSFFTIGYRKSFSYIPYKPPKDSEDKDTSGKLKINRDDLLQKAKDAKNFEDYYEAIFYYRLILEEYPDDRDVQNLLDDAKDLLYEKWKTNQRFREVNKYLSEGQGFLETGEYKLAEYQYQQVQKLDPENKDAENGLLEVLGKKRALITDELNKVQTAYKEKNFSDVLAHLAVIFNYDTNNADALRFLSDLTDYYKQLDQGSESIILESQMNKKKIKMLEVYIEASEEIDAGDLDSALEKLENIKDLHPDNAIVIKKIDLINRLNTTHEEFESEKVLELYKEGLEFYTKGEYKEAIEKWEEVLKLDPLNYSAKRGIIRAKKMLELGE